MIDRLAVFSFWLASMAGVVGIVAKHAQCDEVAVRCAYIGGVGYTLAAACVWRIVVRDRSS
jgi:hypothetical protein